MNSYLKHLCELAGVCTEWLAIDGTVRHVEEDTLKDILALLDIQSDNDEVMQDGIKHLEEEFWTASLKNCYILRQKEEKTFGAIEMALNASNWDVELCLSLHMEDGEQKDIPFKPSEQECLEWREIDGVKLFHIRVFLPEDIPLGYHTLFLTGLVNDKQQLKSRLIVAPSKSYLPDDFYERKYWGLGAHVYCLQGEGYYTNGDFADLNKAIDLAHQAQADFFAINPLHALYPCNPNIASPYSPSSRIFLNPLYIHTPEMKTKENTSPSPWIDWEEAQRERDLILSKRYNDFVKLSDQRAEKKSFSKWLAKNEKSLINYALYNVIAAHLDEADAQKWPAEYSSPHHKAIQKLGKEKAAEVAYYIWQQWLAEVQLEALGKKAKDKLSIGLYGDLAVGVSAFGADAWANDVIISRASFGAPPDDFSSSGQNWGICPFHPKKMEQEGFDSFIQMIRKNMQHFGALRIDHVMGLRQLYWIPKGDATKGAYVRNPYEAFLAIIALESHRAQCIVIGEDLGTVPWGMREEMERENILGYRVFWFERWEGSKLFKRPDTYSYKALASVSTHDLPTVASFWEEKDLAVRQRLQASDAHEQEALKQIRQDDKNHLLAALKDQNLLPSDVSIDNVNMEDLVKALHIFIASTNSQLMFVQLDDLGYEVEPLNVPGVGEGDYPNWRRRLSHSLDEYMLSSPVWDVLSAIRENRGKNE